MFGCQELVQSACDVRQCGLDVTTLSGVAAAYGVCWWHGGERSEYCFGELP